MSAYGSSELLRDSAVVPLSFGILPEVINADAAVCDELLPHIEVIPPSTESSMAASCPEEASKPSENCNTLAQEEEIASVLENSSKISDHDDAERCAVVTITYQQQQPPAISATSEEAAIAAERRDDIHAQHMPSFVSRIIS
jgi:hypothetical protein